jgi:Type II CAAX prenyl endopeptidase Rce1-like
MNLLSKPDKRFLWIILAVGALFLIPGIAYFDQAFTEIGIDFQIGKEEAASLGYAICAELSPVPSDYRRVTVFDVDRMAKTFIELECGVEEVARQTRQGLHIWGWRTRWFKPLEKEEFSTVVSPGGDLIEFEHVIKEDRAGSDATQNEAQVAAEQFASQRFGLDISEYELVEIIEEVMPERMDRTFTFEHKDYSLNEAKKRCEVTVAGNEIVHANRFLKTPEKWDRSYRQLRSRNMLYQSLGQIGMVILVTAAVIFLILRIRRGDLVWKPALFTGMAVGAVFGLNNLNMLPIQLIAYDTTRSLASFYLNQGMMFLMTMAGIGLMILISMSIGDCFYREAYPEKLRLYTAFRWRAWKTGYAFKNVIAAYALTMFHVGLVVLFYVISKRWGVWAPAEVRYSDAVSAYFPIFLPLAISLLAATSEEFIFRFFAIPALRRFSKSTLLAVCLPAFIWGFGHSAYPQQPGFIRGIEVGLIGIAAGYIMIRIGILATLLWHFFMDSIFIGLFMFQSEDRSIFISGIVLVALLLIPLVVVVFNRLKSGSFATADGLMNSDYKPPPLRSSVSKELPNAVKVLPGMSKPVLITGLCTVLIGFVLMYAVPSMQIGKNDSPDKSLSEIHSIADAALVSFGGDPGTLRKTTSYRNTYMDDGLTYVLETEGFTQAQSIYASSSGSSRWVVRYFNFLDKEAYSVHLDPAGEIVNVRYRLEDVEPGANLTQDEARILAEKLVGESGMIIGKLEEIELSSEQFENRTDHTVVYRVTPNRFGDAEERLRIDVIGDRPFGISRWIKAPETWVLEDAQRVKSSRSILTNLLIVIVMALLALTALFYFIRLLRAGDILWKPGLKLGIAAVIVLALNKINQIPGFYSAYQSTQDPLDYLVGMVSGILFQIISTGLGITILVSFAVAVYRTYGAAGIEGRSPIRDMIVGWTGCLLAAGAVIRIVDFIHGTFQFTLLSHSASVYAGLATLLPAWSIFAKGILSGITTGCLVALMFFLIRHQAGQPIRLALGVIVLGLIMGGNAVKTAGFWFPESLLICVILGLAIGCAQLLKTLNIRFYIFLGIASAMMPDIFALWNSNALWFKMNSVLAIVLLLIMIARYANPKLSGQSIVAAEES